MNQDSPSPAPPEKDASLSTAVARLAVEMLSFSDADLERPWAWGSHAEGARFALLGTYQELRELAVRLAAHFNPHLASCIPPEVIMAEVRFTRHLARYFPDLAEREVVDGTTVAEVVTALDERHPGLAAYIIDERGSLRRHVNIFLGQELIHDRTALSDAVAEQDQVFIFQALSGG